MTTTPGACTGSIGIVADAAFEHQDAALAARGESLGRLPRPWRCAKKRVRHLLNRSCQKVSDTCFDFRHGLLASAAEADLVAHNRRVGGRAQRKDPGRRHAGPPTPANQRPGWAALRRSEQALKIIAERQPAAARTHG